MDGDAPRCIVARLKTNAVQRVGSYSPPPGDFGVMPMKRFMLVYPVFLLDAKPAVRAKKGTLYFVVSFECDYRMDSRSVN